MLSEHLALRRAAAKIESGEASPEDLVATAELLTSHVRFEERELFPRIESQLSEAELERLTIAIQEAEKAARDQRFRPS